MHQDTHGKLNHITVSQLVFDPFIDGFVNYIVYKYMGKNNLLLYFAKVRLLPYIGNTYTGTVFQKSESRKLTFGTREREE